MIDRKTGQVEVKEMHAFLDCGPVTNQQIVEGQVNGGIAMGIGQALLEYFPQYEGGPGSGGWNFHQYSVPRAKDVPLLAQEIHFIPPLSSEDDPKGMAEAVLNPIAPAVANAIAHATGKRFRELPILPKHIKESLA
jgi:CO/xanthine dehydrogenase Mo-binding subunit